ncbi:MAG: ADP-glyceromanno-heptose 6-epimerase [Spirochaetota bacterium]|nr:ADP-glyceromanno-heptose 6-epimerase [Spirochaetota bacterium]
MIVVTGGAGFIGSAFVWKLNTMGISDILIVDELGSSYKWKNLVNKNFQDYIHKDEFIKIINNISLNINAIIHMGACSSTTELDADYLMQNNYRYTKTLAEWSLSNNIRFIYASSAATYGDGSQGFSDDEADTLTLQPLNIYGYSKHIFDLWAIRNRVNDKIAGIKFFNVFGPNEYHKGNMASIVFKAYHQIIRTGRIQLFKSLREEYQDGEQLRDFIYVKDCADVMWWLYLNPEINGIFNLGTGTARTWNDLSAAIFSAMGHDLSIEYIDMPDSIKNRYQYFTKAQMDKLRDTGYTTQFRTLEEAVLDYVSNYLTKDNQHL